MSAHIQRTIIWEECGRGRGAPEPYMAVNICMYAGRISSGSGWPAGRVEILNRPPLLRVEAGRIYAFITYAGFDERAMLASVLIIVQLRRYV